MSREKITKKMIQYLEIRINCDNVMKYVDKYIKNNDKNSIIKELEIDSNPVAFEIIKYDATINNNTDGLLGKNDISNMFEIFEIMTEANHTGNEYFPYLYGVLNCHDAENSRVYLYYEIFEGNLINLFSQVEHPSEWYDIAFQLIVINNFMQNLNNYKYSGALENFLYKKLSKPYYKNYDIDGKEFKINHKYLIVLWDINDIKKNTEEIRSAINIDIVLKYLTENKETIKIPPSLKIMKLFSDINNDPKNSISIMHQYYAMNK